MATLDNRHVFEYFMNEYKSWSNQAAALLETCPGSYMQCEEYAGDAYAEAVSELNEGETL